MILVDANDSVVRLDEDKCLQFSCLFDAKELVSSGKINPKLRLVKTLIVFVFRGPVTGDFSNETNNPVMSVLKDLTQLNS